MRILHVLSGLHTGGVQSVVMNYYRQLDRTMIQFDFIVMDSEPGNLEAEALSYGARIYRTPSLFKDKTAFRCEFQKILNSHPEYQIVHVHLNFYNYYVLQIAKECGIKRRISHSHSARPGNSIIVKVGRIIFRFLITIVATDYWACSIQSGKWLYGSKGINSQRFRVVYNAIDIQKYASALTQRDSIREELGLLLKNVYIHVGSFGVAKNHDFLITLFKSVYDKDPHAKLLLLGDGELKQMISQKTQSLGLSSSVEFLGWKTNIELYLAAADVFLFPSLFEGLPVSVVEAQSSGLHCVVSEAVPQEAIINDGCLRLQGFSLNDWLEAIPFKRNSLQKRNEYVNQSILSQYNIVEATSLLERLYLSGGIKSE